MIGKILLLGTEIFTGLVLMLAAYYNGRDTSLTSALGFEFSLRNAIMLAGFFYLIKGLIQLVLEMAEPSTITLIKRFLLLFESMAGFIMMLTSYCDARQSAFEDYVGMDLTINHGLVILGVFYVSKAFFQVVLERGEAGDVAEI